MAIIDRLEDMSRKAVGPPWSGCATASEWDSMSAQQYFDQTVSNPRIKRELELLIQTVLATDPGQVSFLYFLNYVNKCGGVMQLGDGDGGAQTFKVSRLRINIPLIFLSELVWDYVQWSAKY